MEQMESSNYDMDYMDYIHETDVQQQLEDEVVTMEARVTEVAGINKQASTMTDTMIGTEDGSDYIREQQIGIMEAHMRSLGIPLPAGIIGTEDANLYIDDVPMVGVEGIGDVIKKIFSAIVKVIVSIIDGFVKLFKKIIDLVLSIFTSTGSSGDGDGGGGSVGSSGGGGSSATVNNQWPTAKQHRIASYINYNCPWVGLFADEDYGVDSITKNPLTVFNVPGWLRVTSSHARLCASDLTYYGKLVSGDEKISNEAAMHSRIRTYLNFTKDILKESTNVWASNKVTEKFRNVVGPVNGLKPHMYVSPTRVTTVKTNMSKQKYVVGEGEFVNDGIKVLKDGEITLRITTFTISGRLLGPGDMLKQLESYIRMNINNVTYGTDNGILRRTKIIKSDQIKNINYNTFHVTDRVNKDIIRTLTQMKKEVSVTNKLLSKSVKAATKIKPTTNPELASYQDIGVAGIKMVTGHIGSLLMKDVMFGYPLTVTKVAADYGKMVRYINRTLKEK